MGVVYEVYDSYVERVVALKRLSVADERRRARMTALFESEYETLAQLAHPAIVEVYEYGIDDDGPYYTMELLSGGDLNHGVPLPLGEACRVARDVASALALVHARGLVYRDLSPSNVRLTTDGRAKLIDFGALSPFGMPREVVGTAAFMAPECLQKAALDPRVDLYALGALLYWCLTGDHAVKARSLAELPQAQGLPVQAPSELRPELPRALDELVLALLNHDPLMRPSSAADVMHRLTAIASLPPERDAEQVALSYLTRPPLVGREAQLALLVDKLEQAFAGRGHALVLSAARGLGRTALADHVTRHAQRMGAALLRADVGAQCGPFSVIRLLLRAALALDPSLAEAQPLAMQLLAPVEALASRSAGDAAEQEARINAAVRACLLELAQRTPTVIVIDDAQRADAESLGLLVTLAHEAKGRSLLVIASSASDESATHEHAHAKLLEASQLVALTPLAAEHLAALTANIFCNAPNHRRLALWLHRHGGGSPARCLNLARRLLERGIVEYATGIFNLPYDIADDSVAQDLGSELGADLERLSADARSAAEQLAAYDQAVTLEELAEGTALSTRQLVLGVDELIKRGAVRRADGYVAFVHEALRKRVLGSADPARTRATHLRIARALLRAAHPSLDARRRASQHLLAAEVRDEGLTLLRDLAPELARSPEALGKAVPVLETALALHAKLGTRQEALMPLLVPLALAGFFRDPRLLGPYVGRSFKTLLELTGTSLALRLGQFIGRKLALLTGYLYARVRYWVLRDLTGVSFRDLFNALFGVAGSGAAASCAAFDYDFAHRLGEALAPYAGLGAHHPANVVRQYCLTTARCRLLPLAPAQTDFERLGERIADPGASPGLDPEVRAQLLVGALYVTGMVKLLRPGTNGLAIADKMDAQERTFYRPHAELLRMLHYAMRGEQQRAEPHRERTELLALLGGSGWSAVYNTAHRSIVVYQWTQDSINLLRVIADLKRFAPLCAAVEPHLRLAEAYAELLHGRPKQALTIYEEVFAHFPKPSFWTWLGERGRYAEALNQLGRHAEARSVCQAALAELPEEDRVYSFLNYVLEQQLALAEARLGNIHGAENRLASLLEEAQLSANPLLVGSLHRDRAYVALMALDATAFDHHAAAMAQLFRGTKNPALFQQCERLAKEGLKSGFTAPWISTTQLMDPMLARKPENDVVPEDDECTAFLSEADDKSDHTSVS